MRGQHHNQGMDIKPNRLLMLLGDGSAQTKPHGATQEKGTARPAALVPSGLRWDHDLPAPPRTAVTASVTSTVGPAAPQEALACWGMPLALVLPRAQGGGGHSRRDTVPLRDHPAFPSAPSAWPHLGLAKKAARNTSGHPNLQITRLFQATPFTSPATRFEATGCSKRSWGWCLLMALHLAAGP